MRTREGFGVLALLLVVLPLAASAGEQAREGKALREEAMALYKQRQFQAAGERLEQAARLTPGDFELQRMIGACRAMQGDREGAYEAYRAYTQRCPGCLYAPQVRTIIRQYEEANELPLTPRPPEDVAREARRQERLQQALQDYEARERGLAEAPALTSRDELMARRLVANARAIRRGNPLGALANCLEALRRLPRAHPLHAEARELFQEIAWMPAPPLEAPTRGDHTEDDLREAKKRFEEAYVLKATNLELARRKLRECIALTPEEDIYHAKAVKLLRALEGEEE